MKKISKNLPLLLFASAFIVGLLPTQALAHARWVIDSVTPPRSNDTGLKTAPCGGIARTTRSAIFTAGQTIELEFEETVNHPGHYRIAFSPANDQNFDSYVLVDNILDVTNNGRYTQVVTIPNEICSACTLQLIQVMTTDPNPQPNDFYYSCTDIQITNAGDLTAPLPVTSVMNQANDGEVDLSWTNPADDFYQVVILKSTSPIFDVPTNGFTYTAGNTVNGIDVVYVGNSNNYTATGLTNDIAYYFKVFAQNPRKNYAGGIETSATPTASTVGGGSGGTGTQPGDSSPANSGGGSFDWVFLLLVLSIRLLATGKSSCLALRCNRNSA